jgi:hypothetical protein
LTTRVDKQNSDALYGEETMVAPSERFFKKLEDTMELNLQALIR